MKPQTCLSLLVLLSLLSLLSVAVRTDALGGRGGRGAMTGGWSPIEDVKDPHVQEIGEFAVSEYNKQSKTALKFQSVVKGESQVVAGTNYKLVLEAKDGGGAVKNYEAIVWEKPWMHYRNLTSFKPVKGVKW